MSCTLLDTDYTLFVRQVRNMASKLESQEDYIPKHGPRQTETWFISRLGVMPHNSNHKQHELLSAPTQGRPEVVDADVHFPMLGVSGLSTSQLAAIINAVNSNPVR